MYKTSISREVPFWPEPGKGNDFVKALQACEARKSYFTAGN